MKLNLTCFFRAVCVALLLSFPCYFLPPKNLIPQSLAPRFSKTYVEEEAAQWVTWQIQEMLRRGSEINPAFLDEVQEKVTARMKYNPWEMGFLWIWTDMAKLSFEFVVGRGIYTLKFVSQEPDWNYQLHVFRLDDFLRTSREPLVKTASTLEQVGIPQRYIPAPYSPPSFAEEQDRLLAISLEQLHGEIRAFQPQTKKLRSQGEMDWYEVKRLHFVAWLNRLITHFPKELTPTLEPRVRAKQALLRAKVLLEEKKNYGAALSLLVRARKNIWREAKALKEKRLEQIEPREDGYRTLEEIRAEAEAMVQMGHFLVHGEGPVTTFSNYWQRGQDPLNPSSPRLVKTLSSVHYATQRDHIFSLVAAIGNIRETQELFKIYLRDIEILKNLAWTLEEAHALLELLKTSPSQESHLTPEAIQTRLQQLYQQWVAGQKAFLVELIRETTLKMRVRESQDQHHQRRIKALRKELSLSFALRPQRKLTTLLTQSMTFVDNTTQKREEWIASIDLARRELHAIEELESLNPKVDHTLFQNAGRMVAMNLFSRLIKNLMSRKEEKRVLGRDHLLRTFLFLFPEVKIAPVETPKPRKKTKTFLSLLKNQEWVKELEGLSSQKPRYEEALRALNQAYEAFVHVLYEQDSQIQGKVEILQEQKEEFFRRVLRGLQIKGLVNQAQVGMAQKEVDLRLLWKVFAKMERVLKIQFEENGQSTTPEPEAAQAIEERYPPAQESPLLTQVRNLRKDTEELGYRYQSPALAKAVTCFSEIRTLLPPTRSARSEDFPLLTQNGIDQLVQYKEGNSARVKSIEEDGKKISVKIGRKISELLRALDLLITRIEKTWQQREAGVTQLPFPPHLMETYRGFHRLFDDIRLQVDPNLARGQEMLPPLKETPEWKRMERTVQDLQRLLDPPQLVETKAGSPLIKKAGAPAVKMATFNIVTREKKTEIASTVDGGVQLEETKRIIRAQLTFPSLTKHEQGELFSPVSQHIRDMQEVLTEILYEIVGESESTDVVWKKIKLLESSKERSGISISIYQGLNKMADFDYATQEIQLDEDLFGNEKKGIPFNRGLLKLELQLKCDHVEALLRREGVPATPEQLAKEKIKFLQGYVLRFLNQPLEQQEAQLILLRAHREELDQGHFNTLLERACHLKKDSKGQFFRKWIPEFVVPHLLPYILQHYPPVIAQGWKNMCRDRGVALTEIEGLSFHLPSDLDEIGAFLAKEEKEEEGSLQSLHSILSQSDSEKPVALLQIMQRDGKCVAWALIQKEIGITGLFPSEGKKITRLRVLHFKIPQPKAPLNQDYLKALLHFLGAVTLEQSTSPIVFMTLNPSQKYLLPRLRPWVVPFLTQETMAVDEEEEITPVFVNVGTWMRDRFHFFEEVLGYLESQGHAQSFLASFPNEGEFFLMLRRLHHDLGKFSHTHATFSKKQDGQWAYEWDSLPRGENKILNVAVLSPSNRRETLIAFFSHGFSRAIVLWEGKFLVFDDVVYNFLKVPLLEEAQFEDTELRSLETLMRETKSYNEVVWAQMTQSLGQRFIKAGILILEERLSAGSITPQQYWILLAWLTGNKLRMVDTSYQPEWVMESYEPELGFGFPEEVKMRMALAFWQLFSDEAKKIFYHPKKVKEALQEVAKSLNDLHKKLCETRSKALSQPAIAQTLEKCVALREEVLSVNPEIQDQYLARYPIMARNLEALDQVLKSKISLTRKEKALLDEVYRAFTNLKAVHQSYVSRLANEKMKLVLQQVEARVQQLRAQQQKALAPEKTKPTVVYPSAGSQKELPFAVAL